MKPTNSSFRSNSYDLCYLSASVMPKTSPAKKEQKESPPKNPTLLKESFRDVVVSPLNYPPGVRLRWLNLPFFTAIPFFGG